MKPGGFTLLAICLMILVGGFLFACGGGGGGSSPPPPPEVSVSLSPGSGSVSVDNDLQFTATVQNSTNQAVVWSVSGPGCTGNACGTITAGGLYSAPSIVPSPPTVTVKATSVADPSKSGPASVTITSSAAVSVWPALAKVEINGTRQFGGHQDRFFLQSIDPVTGSAPFLAGEVIKQSGGPLSNASLNGTSVFDLVGRPGPDQAKVTVGLLTGNGSGNITGVADINNNNVISANTSYTATYTIDSAGRGTIASSILPGMIFYMVRPGTALLMEVPGRPCKPVRSNRSLRCLTAMPC